MSRSFFVFGLVLVTYTIFSTSASSQLPVKFLGSWDLDHSDNFDEYLKEKGKFIILLIF